MSRKKTHEEFMSQIQGRLGEYGVLSEYKTANDKIKFIHKKCGTEFLMKPMHFVYGEGCKKCAHFNTNVHNFDEFVENLPDKYKDWKFDGYTRATAEVWATCPTCRKKKRYASAKQFVVGQAGCRVCGNGRRASDGIINKELSKLGWEYLGREKARKTNGGYSWQQLKVRCLNCGFEKISSMANLRKYECSVCSGHYDGTSGGEDNLFNWLKGVAPDAVQSDRTVLKCMGKRGYELDIYIPSKQVAIEYNGCYWHSAQAMVKHREVTYAEAKKYHYNKSAECEKQGVRLIHIWDYEWADERKQKVLKNIILGALNMLPERYYARECEVKYYRQDSSRWQELGRFFAENNIQGNRGGSIIFTLEKDGRVLMAYKFGRPSGGKAKQKYEYEMVRGASAPGVQVVGGASKLWKHFVDTVKPKSVVYYIDYNYFNGASVEQLGGKFVGSQPGVRNFWVKTGEVKNREPSRHSEVKKAIQNGDVLELWNAGVKTYEFML